VYQAMRGELGSAVGAIVSFVGLVRDRNYLDDQGKDAEVATLTLEHYPGMTEKSIETIVDQAVARWPLLGTYVAHRVGVMGPNEQIVLVAVASAHRDAAFSAAEFIMDYLKTDAVFWKREATAKSEHWVQSTEGDVQRAESWKQRDKEA
jgi:molybdopterin synthase catalytic subunit